METALERSLSFILTVFVKKTRIFGGVHLVKVLKGKPYDSR